MMEKRPYSVTFPKVYTPRAISIDIQHVLFARLKFRRVIINVELSFLLEAICHPVKHVSP